MFRIHIHTGAAIQFFLGEITAWVRPEVCLPPLLQYSKLCLPLCEPKEVRHSPGRAVCRHANQYHPIEQKRRWNQFLEHLGTVDADLVSLVPTLVFGPKTFD